MGICIRNIEKADDEALAALVRGNLKANGLDIPGTAYFDKALDSLSDFYLADPKRRAYFVVTDKEGEVLAGAGVCEFEAIPGRAELQKLYVSDAAKGQGLGKKLVALCEEKARELGYKTLYLETHTNLKTARLMYEKLGYTRIEKPAGVVHNTMDHFYIKEL